LDDEGWAGGADWNESPVVKGVEAPRGPEFPELTGMRPGAVVEVGARINLAGLMGMGQGHPQGGHREDREGDDVVPGSGETLEDEVEVPSGCRGEELPSEEGRPDGPEAEPRTGHAGGHI
jgi:hypothetical protein